VARVWTLSSGGVVRALSGRETTALAVAFSPDGQRLAVGGGGGMLEIWDLTTGASEVVLAHRGAVSSVGFTMDGRILVSVGTDGVIALYDFVSRQIRIYLREPVALCALALSSDGHRFAYGGEDGLLRLRDLDGGDRGQPLLGHQGRVCSLGFSGDGKLLVSVSADRSVRLWDFSVGTSRSFLGGDDAFSAALSPDGTKIARGGADGMVRLFRAAAAGEVPPAAGLRAWLAAATRAKVDANGKLTAAGP
jgi:WD40 repeat protein